MKFTKHLAIACAMVISTISISQQASASECGLSCCIASGVDGVGANVGLTVSLQYDSMLMKTNKQGTNKISNQQIISDRFAVASPPMMYAVSNKMTMNKIAANFSYRMDEDNAFVLSVPYIENDMEMMMARRATPTTYTYSQMDTIRGLGDVSLIYLRDVYKDADIRTRERFSIGAGIKAPTGAYQARTSTGFLVHMMMQAGTGSWDGYLSANGTLGFGEHEDGGAQWLISPSAMYQITTRNNLGYKVGNRFNYDISTRYRVSSNFNAKLDVNGVWSQRDSTDGTADPAAPDATVTAAYQRTTNVLDNVANTGVHSLFISPGFQWLMGDGWNISGEYRIPVYQNVNGIQQVTDNWFFARITKSF